MKVSTKGRYGLRALVELAAHEQQGAISLINIAERQNISLNYLEQVFATLRKAGVVKSVKGSAGGYMLANPAENIMVSEILNALEGRFQIVEEVETERGTDCIQQAIQRMVWEPIDEAVNDYFKTLTLGELVKRYQEMKKDEGAEKWEEFIEASRN